MKTLAGSPRARAMAADMGAFGCCCVLAVTTASNRSIHHHWLALAPSLHKEEEEGMMDDDDPRPRQVAFPMASSTPTRLVLACPDDAGASLRNPRAETEGAIVLVRRGGCSFVDKVRRAVEAKAAAVVIGNNDKAHPHAVFAMPGDWAFIGGGSRPPPPPVVMVSFACFEQLCSLVRLEADLRGEAGPLSLLQGSVRPLQKGGELARWELGAAIRALTRDETHDALRALLAHVDACADDGQEAEATAPVPYNEADPETGSTPLHMAVERNAFLCLGHLLQCRSIARVLDQPRRDLFRPIHLAASRPDRAVCLSMLLCAGSYVDVPHELSCWTPLHFACGQGGCLDAVRVLVKADAALDARAADGSTALLVAVRYGHPPLVAALLEAGANIFIPNHQGKTPLDFLKDEACACRQVIQRHQQHGVTRGSYEQPGDLSYHWAAAPWLAARCFIPPSTQRSQQKPPSPRPPDAPTLEVLSFLNGGTGPYSSSSGLPMCRVVFPWAVFQEALAARRGDHHHHQRGQRCPVDLQEELAALLAVQTPSDGKEAGERILQIVAEAAHASWSAGVLPPLSMRGRLVALELPASLRPQLWLALATCAGQDALLASPSPVHTLAIEPRVQCLYRDLQRTKFAHFAQGEGMERLRRLILAWLHVSDGNHYRQGLTSLASVFLEVFPVRRSSPSSTAPSGWHPVADRQALHCLSRVIELHMDGLFSLDSSLSCLQRRMRLIETLVQYWDPALALHLAGHDITGELFSTPWLVTLFADVLPMGEVVAVLDMLLTLGRGFCLCFSAAIVLQLRDALLNTTNTTTLLLTFSRLNAEVKPMDVPSCLDRALHLYAKTPEAILGLWDGGSSCAAPRSQSGVRARWNKNEVEEKRQGNVQADCERPPPELPHVLNRIARLSAQDLQDLREGFADEDNKRGAVVVLDVRETTMGEQCGSGNRLPSCLPSVVHHLQLPFSTIRGHVDYCRPFRTLRKDMRPPAVVRPFVGMAHVVVYAGKAQDKAHDIVQQRAEDVARMLILCRVPLVSIYAANEKEVVAVAPPRVA